MTPDNLCIQFNGLDVSYHTLWHKKTTAATGNGCSKLLLKRGGSTTIPSSHIFIHHFASFIDFFCTTSVFPK